MNTNERILLVEDDHSTRELIEEILSDEGYSLSSVQNGLEAKELLKTTSFGLLITDFKMPGLNGVELLKWCRSENITAPVMFMTAASSFVPEEASALMNSHATFVPKPLNLELFLKTIAQTLTPTSDYASICN